MSIIRRNYVVTYKVLVLGEASVGKTALIQSYTEKDKPFDAILPTIGNNYSSQYSTSTQFTSILTNTYCKMI